jgi:hypothetical protein
MHNAPGSEMAGAIGVPWIRIWLLALATCAGAMTGVEAALRHCGFKPDVPDSVELWAYQRSRVVGNDPHLLVAIGTSRIRADISPEIVAHLLPGYKLIQLGVNGPDSAAGLLIDLCSIPGFRGVIVCDILPPLFAKSRWDGQAAYYRSIVGRRSALRAFLYGLVYEKFVAVNPACSMRHLLLRSIGDSAAGEEQYYRVHADRSIAFEYASQVECANVRNTRFAQHVRIFGSMPTDDDVKRLRGDIRALAVELRTSRATDCRLVFVRFPSSGRRFALEESRFASRQYMDLIARVTNTTWIDFRNLPTDSVFECPDESHLSPQGARRFTSCLIRELQRQGIVRSL